MSRSTREPQYNRCLEVADSHGLTPMGLMANQVWCDDPRRMAFVLSRYKFVSKMLSGKEHVLEAGCGDAFGTRLVQQEVENVTVIDFDPILIEDVRSRSDERWPLESRVHDMLSGPVESEPPFDAAYSLDVIEHISKGDDETFVGNLAKSLAPHGTLIVGSPSLESQTYASPPSKVGHVNCMSGPELKELMSKFFRHVFIFSMNDEVVHTGFYPMAHYLFALCCEQIGS